jgi:cell division protein FtsZ
VTELGLSNILLKNTWIQNQISWLSLLLNPEIVVPAELNITMKQVDTAVNTAVDLEAISPMEMTIEESLRMRELMKEEKLKEFNYKFHIMFLKLMNMKKNQLTKDWE